MKGIVKLVLFLAVAYALVKLAGHVEWRRWLPGGDGPKLAVLSVECITGGMARAEVRVRNTGDVPLESPIGVVRFGAAKQSGGFSPATIAPDGTATLVVYPLAGDPTDCELISVADKDGRSTVLAQRPKFTNPRDRVQVFP